MKQKGVYFRITALILCLFLLCSCGEAVFNASDYVKGGLDVLYRGEVSEEYLSLVTETREECLAAYEENVENEAKSFCSLLLLDAGTERPDERLTEFYRQVFSKCSYEVRNAVLQGDRCSVAVSVRPFDLFRSSYEELDMFDREFARRSAEGEFDGLDDGEINKEYLYGMLDVLYACIDGAGYLEPTELQILLDRDENGVWHIDENSLAEFHNLLIAY